MIAHAARSGVDSVEWHVVDVESVPRLVAQDSEGSSAARRGAWDELHAVGKDKALRRAGRVDAVGIDPQGRQEVVRGSVATDEDCPVGVEDQVSPAADRHLAEASPAVAATCVRPQSSS